MTEWLKSISFKQLWVSELTLLSDCTENRASWPETSLYFRPFLSVAIECAIWKLLNEKWRGVFMKNGCKHYHMFCAADESDWNNPKIHIGRSAVTSGWRLMPTGGSEHHMWDARRWLSEIIQLQIKWFKWRIWQIIQL